MGSPINGVWVNKKGDDDFEAFLKEAWGIGWFKRKFAKGMTCSYKMTATSENSIVKTWMKKNGKPDMAFSNEWTEGMIEIAECAPDIKQKSICLKADAVAGILVFKTERI